MLEPARTPHRILLVEDNPGDAHLIRMHLRERAPGAFQLEESRRMSEALLRLERGSVDLVLLDLALPDSQGIATFLELHAQFPGVPVVVMTGLDDQSLAVQAVSAGAQDYLVKGRVDAESLRRSLRYAIERQRLVAVLTEVSRDLEGSEARLRFLVQNSSDAIWIVAEDGVVRYVNDTVKTLLGHQPAELIGKSLHELVHEDDLGDVRKALESAVAAPGEDRAFSCRLRDRDRRFRELETVCRSVPDPWGSRSLVLNSRDVTERRELEERYRQAQKMEAVGRLAGGIAHDFNNLLTVITGYGELLLSEGMLENRTRFPAEEIVKAGQRAAALTRQLLAFSRRQVLQAQVIDLNVVVADMDRMVRRLIGEDIEVVTRLDSRLRRVKVDPNQMEQVLLNLVVNARDAMPGGGRLTIETANRDVDEEFARSHPGVEPGACVMLAVSDNGHGMDAEVRSRIFEPFFTTKPHEKGSGLGLATVYGIVRQSGGSIWVESEPDQGASFKIYLPRTSDPPLRGSRPVPVPIPAGGSETVLLVEDESAVRGILSNVLRGAGYEVLEAANGVEALRLVTAGARPIHLAITDLIMPEMGGWDLAQRLHRTHPQIKVLFISGYAENAALQQSGIPEGAAYLEKPFTPWALALKVREVLES